MKKIHKNRRGFTLIELLVVIAIIAVLSIVVILTLNPAELLRQARDSNRISDLATIKSAISLFMADGQATSSGSGTGTAGTAGSLGKNGVCYFFNNGVANVTNTCTSWFTTQPTAAATSGVNSRAVNGIGWVPVNFSLITSGSPIGQEPIDPVAPIANANYFYSYYVTSTSFGFKLAAKTESVKYSASGTSDIESTDGGGDNFTYEQGTNLSL